MKLFRLFLLGILACLFVAGSVYAQGVGATSGTLQGVVTDNTAAALPGVLVSATGPSGAKSATTDVNGKFIFPYLTPGVYSVRAELSGYTTVEQGDVDVRLGQRVEITFKLNPGKEEMIVVTGESPVVDVSSTTTGANISEKLIQSIPVGRGIAASINLAPGVTNSGVGGGNYSISGASGLENTYIVDGVNITDPGYGGVGSYSINFGSLGSGFTQDMVKETQVKSGGFEPEYGQALGGVVNVITKSGSNDFSGAAYGYFSPRSMEGDRTLTGPYIGFLRANIKDTQAMDGGANVGGPVFKDRLFFWGAYNPRKNEWTIVNDPEAPKYALYPEVSRERTSQNYSLKLTGNITANNTVEFSTFGDPSKGKVGWQRTAAIISTNPVLQRSALEYGSNSQVGRWTGILRNNMFAEAQVGRSHSTFTELLEDNSPAFYDYTTVPTTRSGGLGFYDAGSIGTNLQYTLKMTNIWKGHEIRYGVQYEAIDYSGGAQYTGPTFMTFIGKQSTTGAIIYKRPAGVATTRCPQCGSIPFYYYTYRDRVSPSPVPTSTGYLNWFAQDSWNITSYLNVKAGVRWEQQNIKGDIAGSENITFKNNWAPRLGATYDYLRNGKSKAFFHYGRFFEKVPNDLAVRALVAEQQTQGFYYDAALANPIPGTGILVGGSSEEIEGLGKSNSPYTTKAQYSDEYVAGVEQELAPGFSMGGRFIYRTTGKVLEDVQIDLAVPCVQTSYGPCVAPGITAENYYLGHTSNYFITNMDGHYPGFPALTRYYKGVELTFEKRLSQNWQLMGSYRWSKLDGNYEGLFRRDNGQSDPNITSLGDFAESPYLFYTFSRGILPNDVNNMVKVFASYRFGFGLNTGLGVNAAAGTPMSKLGDIPGYGTEERVLEPRGSLGRTPSIYTFDIHADYGINAGPGQLTFGLDVFNLFNQQRATDYILSSQEDTGELFGQTPDPDYLRINGYQDPRQIRFLIKYGF